MYLHIILLFRFYDDMARQLVLSDETIVDLLGNGQNSDISDFSDDSDNGEEYFATDEMDNLLAVNELF